ncbi:hypothetical protein DSO57_1022083 [Entomophthora muscae]|uniref:Uncharacterized protein n=1 Tax=Entomophthora muscae TaxID=34485 RepID=A0ACC2TQN8_9FUNG|nr:hypothetical protein DSO57_1022083 [Entomophthora muscae]
MLSLQKLVSCDYRKHLLMQILPAEFWCTITSIFFAMPLLVLGEFDFYGLSPLLKTFIILSVITATMSFVYHWTLMKIYSSADCAFATIMIALGTTALCIKNPFLYFIDDQPEIWVSLIIITGIIFVIFWETTALTSLVLFAIFVPINIFCLFQLGYWDTLLSGAIGISCFLADRKGIAPTHSLWHFFGGLHLYYLCLSLIAN